MVTIVTGGLHGGPQCCISILIKFDSHVTCFCCLFSSMSNVELKNRLSPILLQLCTSCHIPRTPTSHVEFKNGPCRHFDLGVKGHSSWPLATCVPAGHHNDHTPHNTCRPGISGTRRKSPHLLVVGVPCLSVWQPELA